MRYKTTLTILHVVIGCWSLPAQAKIYAVVDTGQSTCYNDVTAIAPSPLGQPFYGQDAQHLGNQPSYASSANGLTVYDNNTDLTWTQTPDLTGNGVIDVNDKLTFPEAQDYVTTLNTQSYGGYGDWRLPTIKELYSLIDFRGVDPSSYTGTDTSGLTPFIDTNHFAFGYGDTGAGERIIDAQYWSNTEYVSTTMNGDHTVFGVNFADGRIKGYGTINPQGSVKTEYALYVRGNSEYGVNHFIDNQDSTITDDATGLMWSKSDSGVGMNWEESFEWVAQRNADKFLGHDDWRLPDAKELQSIVDYTRSPETTNSAAIDPIFDITAITDEGGDTNFPFFWTSTTHVNMQGGEAAAYLAFGEALGWMQQQGQGTPVLMDVHGAGAQRSDPKNGDSADWPYGRGPQGDVIRIDNYVRLVRDVATVPEPGALTLALLALMGVAIYWLQETRP